MITRAPVKSSNIEEVGYDPVTKTLAVKFKNGGLYHYADVGPEVHAELVKADSIGGFLHSHVKCQFKAIKQEDDESFPSQ